MHAISDTATANKGIVHTHQSTRERKTILFIFCLIVLNVWSYKYTESRTQKQIFEFAEIRRKLNIRIFALSWILVKNWVKGSGFLIYDVCAEWPPEPATTLSKKRCMYVFLIVMTA